MPTRYSHRVMRSPYQGFTYVERFNVSRIVFEEQHAPQLSFALVAELYNGAV
jgi:hypothetical protein